MNDLKLCTICDSHYESHTRRPQVLSCGHSFCLSCLEEIQRHGSNCCPLCRTVWGEADAQDLPTCYQLIPDNTPRKTGQSGRSLQLCIEHNFSFIYFCKTCQRSACKVCMLSLHKNCELGLIEDFKTGISMLGHEVKGLKEKCKYKLEKIVYGSSETYESLVSVREFSRNINTLEDKLVRRLSELGHLEAETESDMNSMEEDASDDSIRTLLQKVKNSSFNNEIQKDPLLQIVKFCLEIDTRRDLAGDMIESYNVADAMKNASLWTIEGNVSACAALISLHEYNNRPTSILLDSKKVNQKLVQILMNEVRDYECVLQFRYLESFWHPTNKSLRENALMIQPFLDRGTYNYFCKDRVSEFWGRLSKGLVKRMNLERVIILGLPLATEEDQAAVSAVFEELSTESQVRSRIPVYNCASFPGPSSSVPAVKRKVSTEVKIPSSLEYFHLCVPKEVSLKMLRKLHPRLQEIKLCLHFCGLGEDDLNHMMQIIEALIPANGSTLRLAALYLPESNFTEQGLMMLLGVLHSCAITNTVYLECDSLSQAVRTELSRSYWKWAITLIFGMKLNGAGPLPEIEEGLVAQV